MLKKKKKKKEQRQSVLQTKMVETPADVVLIPVLFPVLIPVLFPVLIHVLCMVITCDNYIIKVKRDVLGEFLIKSGN